LYELGERYSTIVTSEIRELGDRFDQYFSIGGVQAVKCAIQREARLKQKENPNSFYAAMLRGMLASDWYCDVGFRNIGKGVLAAPLQLAGNVPQTRSTTDFQNLSLEKFLQLPNSDIAKYEHVKGIVRKKAGLKAKYLELQDHLSSEINRVVKSGKSAYALPDSRCTFGNRSLLPDIAVFQGNNIPTDENGEIQKCFNLAPDWMIEILTPERSSPRVIENILFSLQHGSQLGWLIDSDDYSVIVFHPDKLAEFKERDDQLSIIDAISNWQLTAAGLFALMD
jgi:Uma2 family endonuclease